MQSDEKEGFVAAAVIALCALFMSHRFFWMGKKVGVRLINDNLVKPDKLIFRAFEFFFF